MKIRQQFLCILIFALFILGNAGHFMLPQVFTSSQGRTPRGTTKANLHNMYLACNSFWAAEGDSKTCTVSIATQKEYGWIQSQDVKIYGSGTKNDFCAVAWHQGNNILRTIDSRGILYEDPSILWGSKAYKNRPDKIWIYEKLFPRHLFYYSIIWILPIATIILTIWAGGSSILRKKKMFSYLTEELILVIWAFISLVAFVLAFDDYLWYSGTLYMLLAIPPVFSFGRAFSLIRWGKQIETGKELPYYFKNQNAKKLKKSGAYLYGVIGFLLAVNITYGFMDENYRIGYQNQSVKWSEEILSSIQTDPSLFQKMCQ